jgi:hypothetical protein
VIDWLSKEIMVVRWHGLILMVLAIYGIIMFGIRALWR